MRTLIISALLATTALGLAARAQEPSPPPVVSEGLDEATPERAYMARISLMTGWDALPALIAVERGFLREENIIPSLTTINNMEALQRSLRVGSSDIAVVPHAGFLALAALDVPMKAIAFGAATSQYELTSGPLGPADLSSLRGRRIGAMLGSAGAGVLVRVLDTQGLTPGDVDIQMLPGDQLFTALASGEVDAVFADQRLKTLAAPIEGARVLLSTQGVQQMTGALCADALVASNVAIEREPEMLEALSRAWAKSLTYISENPGDALRVLSIYSHRQGQDVNTQNMQAWLAALRYGYGAWHGDLIQDATFNAWGLSEIEALPTSLDVTKYVDERFVSASAG